VPQNNKVLNQVYANVLGKPVLVPDGIPTSLGSGIFAMLAAGAFSSVEEAQAKMCLPYKTYEPEAKAVRVYEELYSLYRKVYFAFGLRGAAAVALGDVLPKLIEIRTVALASEQGNSDAFLVPTTESSPFDET
jgi:L-ribulokinase